MALGHRRDARHEQVAELFRSMRTSGVPLCTSNYVLDELITLLFRREAFGVAVKFIETLLEAVEVGHVTIVTITVDRFQKAWSLRKRFHDKPRISFTDLSSMVVMVERGIRKVITDDDHFVHVGCNSRRYLDVPDSCCRRQGSLLHIPRFFPSTRTVAPSTSD